MSKKSLHQDHSKRWDIALLLVISIGMLIVGWFLPTFKLKKLIFGSDEYSIWQSVVALWKAGSYILSMVILFFSMIFPLAKLIVLFAVWFKPMGESARSTALHWLAVLGKWSMLDVFVVAMIVVLVKASSFTDANAMYGIYVFGVAVVISMVVTMMIEKVAKPKEA